MGETVLLFLCLGEFSRQKAGNGAYKWNGKWKKFSFAIFPNPDSCYNVQERCGHGKKWQKIETPGTERTELIMAQIRPFQAVRPQKTVADRVAALPYDVYNRREAKEETIREPLSFLRIDRAETQLDDAVDTYAPE